MKNTPKNAKMAELMHYASLAGATYIISGY